MMIRTYAGKESAKDTGDRACMALAHSRWTLIVVLIPLFSVSS